MRIDKGAAVFVAFYPEGSFYDQLRATVGHVCKTLIFNNGGFDSMGLQSVNVGGQLIEILGDGTNVGLGAAYNASLERAETLGLDWIIIFDQDTRFNPALIRQMVDVFGSLSSTTEDMILGASPEWDHHGKAVYFSMSSLRVFDATAVVSSGTLIRIRDWQRIGLFREDYFIDQLDFEYCLRARKLGYKIYKVSSSFMKHAVGRPISFAIGKKQFFAMNYEAERVYYQARNLSTNAILYFVFEPRWITREVSLFVLRVLFIVLAERNKINKLIAVFKGLADAMIGRMGKRVG